MKLRSTIVFSAAAVLLGGCAQTVQKEPTYTRAQDVLNAVSTAKLEQRDPPEKGYHSDGAWLGLRVVDQKRERSLPREFSDPVLFRSVFADQATVDITTVIDRMSKIGIQVRLDADVTDAGTKAPTTPQATGATAAAAAPVGGSAQGSMAAQLQAYKFSYTKAQSVSDLLDLIAAKAGLVWDVRSKTVFFYRYETRTFQLAVVPGIQLVKVGADSTQGGAQAGTSSGAGGSSTGRSSGQAVQTGDATFDPLKQIVAVMESMKTTTGKVKANEATNTITVTDAPEVVERIAKYFAKENARLARQVMVSFKIYSIKESASNEYGLDWSALYSSLSGNKTVSLSNPSTAAAGSTRLSFGVLNDTRRVELGLTALSQAGHAALVDEASDVVLNYRPKTLHSTASQAYISEVNVSQVVNAGTQTSVRQATLDVGFKVQVTPAIQDNDAILLKTAIDLSNLDNLEARTVGTTRVDLPSVSRNLSLGEIALRNGQSVMIVGLSRERVNDATSGALPKTILAGGNTRAGGQKERLMMLITPVIVEGSH